MNPTCCGQPSTWVNISHNLQYFYCKECKKEVPEKIEPVDSPKEDDTFWAGEIFSLWPGHFPCNFSTHTWSSPQAYYNKMTCNCGARVMP